MFENKLKAHVWKDNMLKDTKIKSDTNTSLIIFMENYNRIASSINRKKESIYRKRLQNEDSGANKIILELHLLN